MSNKAPKSLSDLIGSPGNSLGSLASQAQRRADLSDYLRDHLEPSLSAGFVHCNARDDGTLVVVAVNSEWAARLRFESQQLLQLCQSFGSKVHNVKIRVAG